MPTLKHKQKFTKIVISAVYVKNKIKKSWKTLLLMKNYERNKWI